MLDALPNPLQRWLIKHQIQVVAVFPAKKRITIAIDDPINEILIEKILSKIAPYQAKFVLIDPTS